MLERTRPEGCLSDLAFDRLMAGELGDGTAERRHIAGCASCAARVAEIEADRDRFRAMPPALAAGGAAVRRPWWRRAWLVSLVPAAAAVLLFLLVRGGGEEPPDPGGGTRAKGGHRLGFYLKRGGAVTRGAGGDQLAPGDEIRFAITTRERGWLVIASVDGAGVVSVYYPDGERAAAVEPGDDQLLPGSVILDDVLGDESVHAFLCGRPLATAELRAALEAGRIEVAGCAVDTIRWEKR